MKYDDLEKTQDLFDIKDGVPTPIENIEDEGVSKDNLTGDLTFGLVSEDKSDAVKGAKETEVNNEKVKNKKHKKSLKEKWQGLTKKKKALIIIIILLVIIGMGIGLFFLVKKFNKPEDKTNKEDPSVIVEKDFYRYQGGILTFLDKEDNELGTYECTNKAQNLCYIATYSNEDNFDITKNEYEDGSEFKKSSKIYLDNYVFIYDNESEEDNVISLYNIKEERIENTYTLIKGFSDSDYVILKDDKDKYGAILFNDGAYEEKIKFAYSYLGMLNKDSNVVAKNKNEYTIYNQNGDAKSKALNYEVKSYNNSYVVMKDKDSYYLFDYNNERVLDEEFDFIGLLDKYVVLVKDDLLYIRDYDNNKYHEEGIKLSSKDYIPINVYNEDKRLMETKQAFTINNENGVINVYYKKDKSVTINPIEGKISAKLTFINYFDGKLYIYKDEAKQELLGSYTCSNKNIVSSDKDTFNTCMLAKETFFSTSTVEENMSDKVGLLPVFNQRFIFVQDSIDSSNPTIILYDLKNKKTLSKYSVVDAGTYAEDGSLTFIDTQESYVMARNKSKKYGVIKIEEEVESAISFDYVKIEKVKDYYMAQGNSDNYMLINGKGEIITDKLGRKIIDYEGDYLKVMDSDGRYYVTDFRGESSDSTGYLDITLGSDYYVVVTTDYVLDILKYDDPTFSLSTQIDIGENYKNNYVVTKASEGYIIRIKNPNTTYTADLDGIIF